MDNNRSKRKKRPPKWLMESEMIDNVPKTKQRKKNARAKKEQEKKAKTSKDGKSGSNKNNNAKRLTLDSCSFQCQLCNRQYPTKVKYRQHMRGVHSIRVGTNEKQYRCPITSCHQTNSCRNKYFEHLEQIHQIEIEQIMLTFNNYEGHYNCLFFTLIILFSTEFFDWKRVEESRTQTHYLRNQRIYKNKEKKTDGHFDYYYCSKSGYYNSRDKWIQKLPANFKDDIYNRIEQQDVNGDIQIKMGSLCPARIRVEYSVDPMMLMVEFTQTHIGHESYDNSFISKKLANKKSELKENFSQNIQNLEKTKSLKKTKLNAKNAKNNLNNKSKKTSSKSFRNVKKNGTNSNSFQEGVGTSNFKKENSHIQYIDSTDNHKKACNTETLLNKIKGFFQW